MDFISPNISSTYLAAGALHIIPYVLGVVPDSVAIEILF